MKALLTFHRVMLATILVSAFLLGIGGTIGARTAAASLPAAFTGASIDSESGANVNPLHSETYAQSFPASQIFEPDDNSNVIGFALGGELPGPDNWSLAFIAPNQGVLEPGTYDNALGGSIGVPSTSPGLNVASEIGCNQQFGQFTVLDVTYSSPGELGSFAATFEDHCEGQGPATFGDISYNSTAPFYGDSLSTDNLVIDTPETAPGISGFMITNTGQSPLNIFGGYFSGTAASDFFVAYSTCSTALAPGARCEFDIGYNPPADNASSEASFSFYDELATQGPPGAPATNGTGRDVTLDGESRPTVTSVKPRTGPTSGGTAITIRGTNFTTGATVVIGQGSGAGIGAIAATDVVVVSPTEITAVTGGKAKAGTWSLFVTTSKGTSLANSGDDFAYEAAAVMPTVTSVSPNSGPTAGGTTMTITGTGFVTGASVVVGQGAGPQTGAIAATNVKVVSPTEITATTGGGAKAGTWNLFVRTPGGTSPPNTGDDFTY
jgi:hypothetical protein